MNKCTILLAAQTCDDDDVAEIGCLWWTTGETQRGSFQDALHDASQRSLPVFLVIPAAWGLLAQVTLSRRQARYIRKILPSILEDVLLDSPEALWFSHGKPVDGRYPVVICQQSRLESLRDAVLTQGLSLMGVWMDADLISEAAPVIFPVADSAEQTLVLTGHKAVSCASIDMPRMLAFAGLDDAQVTTLDLTQMRDCIDSALDGGRGVMLLHSELRVQARAQQVGHRSPLAGLGLRPLVSLSAAVLACIWALQLWQGWYYNTKSEQLAQQAADLYEDIFPGDQATPLLISQFSGRIRQLSLNGSAQSSFLELMQPTGEAIARLGVANVELRRIIFDEREGQLQIDVSAGTFERLEEARNSLLDQGLSAEITEGRSQGDRVAARIRIRSSS